MEEAATDSRGASGRAQKSETAAPAATQKYVEDDPMLSTMNRGPRAKEARADRVAPCACDGCVLQRSSHASFSLR